MTLTGGHCHTFNGGRDIPLAIPYRAYFGELVFGQLVDLQRSASTEGVGWRFFAAGQVRDEGCA
jgi:hypothetical protein